MISFSGFSVPQPLADLALEAAISKLEGKAGAPMARKNLDFTLINTDLWTTFPRGKTHCYLCSREVEYSGFSGVDGFEIHASQAEIEGDPAKLIRTLYHMAAHATLLHCGLPESKWKDAPKNARKPNLDVLVVAGQSYPVQEVAL